MVAVCWLPFHKIALSELVNRQSVQSMLLYLKAVTAVRDKKAEQTRLWTGRAEQTRKPNTLSGPTKLTLLPLKFRIQSNLAIPHFKIAPTEAVRDKNSTLVKGLITGGSGSLLWEKDSLWREPRSQFHISKLNWSMLAAIKVDELSFLILKLLFSHLYGNTSQRRHGVERESVQQECGILWRLSLSETKSYPTVPPPLPPCD